MMETVAEVRMSGGTEFQRLGAGRLKALHPMVVKLAHRAKSRLAEGDRRVNKFIVKRSCQVLKDLESEEQNLKISGRFDRELLKL